MTAFTSDHSSAARPDEAVYPGRSPWKVCCQLILVALAFGAVAAAFATSEEFRTRLRVDPTASRWAAGLGGGVATILFVCAAWQWHGRLRWVAISPDGIRWHSGRGVKARRWQEFVRVERGTIEMSVYGEELKTGRYAEVLFKHGRPLRISTLSVRGYEDLIAEIQSLSGAVVRIYVPGGGSPGGTPVPGSVVHGPLRFDDNGVGWDAVSYRWDEVESYEVAYGMLRIQPAGGPEFLRRLCDLGDWGPAVSKLDRQCGSRRVGKAAAVR